MSGRFCLNTSEEQPRISAATLYGLTTQMPKTLHDERVVPV